jgi:hypothetical protein
MLTGGDGRIVLPRESLVLYESLNTLWLGKYGVDYIKSRVSGAAARNRTAADILHTSIELDKQLFHASVKHTMNLNSAMLLRYLIS